MLLKIIGAVLTVASGVFIGEAFLRKYKNKVIFWENVLSFLSLCEREIFYCKEDFLTILDKFRQSGAQYADIISHVCQYTTKDEKLSEKENSFLLRFTKELLSLDSETQKKCLSSGRQEGEENIKKAKEEEKRGKTFKKLFPLLAVGIVILFL